MALLEPSYIGSAVVLGTAQVAESTYLLYRRGVGSIRNIYFGFIELIFAVVSAIQAVRPFEPTNRPVALAYIAYFTVASVLGFFYYRRAGWKYTVGQPLMPFPILSVRLNLIGVFAFTCFAAYVWLA